MSLKEKKPIREGFWNSDNNEVYLLGSKCNLCGELYFPQKENGFCTQCQSRQMETVKLGNEGVITTFTVVHQQPAGGFYKGPVPFAYGIVQLPEGVKVETHFTGCEFEQIRVGLKARLVIDKLCDADENTEILTYKFVPIL